jgi:uncharacterized protein
VNFSQRPFRTNIGFIINKPAGYSREFPYEIENFILDRDFEIRDLTGTITLARTSSSIRALVDFSGKIDGTCGRCLDQFEMVLNPRFDQIYTFEKEPLSEEEEIVPADGYIDFEILLREYLLMEIPMNPLCRSDCKGLCSACGQNLNEKLCEHQKLETNKAALDSRESKQPKTTAHSG